MYKYTYYFYCRKCDSITTHTWGATEYLRIRGDRYNEDIIVPCHFCPGVAERVFEEFRNHPCSHGSHVQNLIDNLQIFKPLGGDVMWYRRRK